MKFLHLYSPVGMLWLSVYVYWSALIDTICWNSPSGPEACKKMWQRYHTKVNIMLPGYIWATHIFQFIEEDSICINLWQPYPMDINSLYPLHKKRVYKAREKWHCSCWRIELQLSCLYPSY